ncbi:unnamed protein product [Larinioides sclopetarius]|uniref:Uncharacterized protein n=1 Tax=Larinioides sclopetarius TaxID=280406 RepID=A0AAV2AWR1_9ARAC
MEYHHDVAKDLSSENSSNLDMNSKFVDDISSDESFELINETPQNVVSITSPKLYYNFSLAVSSYSASNTPHHNIAGRSNYSTFANTSVSDMNSQSIDNPSDSEESFEFIDGKSDDVNYVIETETCYGPRNVSSISLQDSEETNYTLTATASMPNASNLSCDESFELINETSGDSLYMMKFKKLPVLQNVSPNSTSNLESHCAEDKKFTLSSNVSLFDMNSLSVDSNESFELINKTPEKVLYAKETQQSCSLQKNVSSSSISNMKSVHNTAFKKKCSSPVEVCANNEKPSQEKKILAPIAERTKVSPSANIPGGSGRISADGRVMKGLIKGIRDCNIADNRLNAANNNQFDMEYHHDVSKDLFPENFTIPAKCSFKFLHSPLSMLDERPNPENKKLLRIAKKKDVSIPANVCKLDNKMGSDIVKKVIKGIESCRISNKQFNSNTAFDKNCSGGFKINLDVNKHNLVLPKNNLTYTNVSNEDYEPKCNITSMVAKGKKRCCDELFSLPYAKENKTNCDEHRPQVYEVISDGEKEKNGEVFPACKFLYILRSDCLCYLNELKQTIDDKDGFKSDYSGSRLAQESKLRDLFEKNKDKRRTTKKMKKNAHKWANREKKGFSWRGFDFDF